MLTIYKVNYDAINDFLFNHPFNKHFAKTNYTACLTLLADITDNVRFTDSVDDA